MLSLFACGGQPAIRGYSGDTREKHEIAVFKVPSMFDVISFDSRNISQSILTDGAIIEMLPGNHQLVLEYDDFWEFEAGTHIRFKSEPFVMSIQVQIGKTYSIGMDELKDIDDVSKFVENPMVWVVEINTGRKINTEIVYNLESKAKYDRFSSVITPLNQGGTINHQTEKALQGNSVLPQPKTIENLKYWWDKANMYEQDSFRRWINEN